VWSGLYAWLGNHYLSHTWILTGKIKGKRSRSNAMAYGFFVSLVVAYTINLMLEVIDYIKLMKLIKI